MEKFWKIVNKVRKKASKIKNPTEEK